MGVPVMSGASRGKLRSSRPASFRPTTAAARRPPGKSDRRRHPETVPPGADPAGAPRACVVRGDDEEAPPSADKACYASCAGSLSATHAAAALSHVVA